MKYLFPKTHDTDSLFRNTVVNQFEKHYDTICRSLDINSRITFTGITNEVEKMALDSCALFQRALVENHIYNNFTPSISEQKILATFLDRTFALANASASDAYPVTLILNQLTGRSMAALLSKVYPKLYHNICSLSWSAVYYLSTTATWLKFVRCINAFIYIIQDFHKNHESLPIDDIIQKFNSYSILYDLVTFIKDKAIDNIKSKMYEQYIFSQSQDPSQIFDLLLDCYNGKYKQLLDVVIAINLFREAVEKEILSIKYNYLQDLGSKQHASSYEILH